jgi:hypothetical protein
MPDYPNKESTAHLVSLGPSAGSKALVPYVDGKISYNPNHPEFRGFEYLKSVTPSGIVPKVLLNK